MPLPLYYKNTSNFDQFYEAYQADEDISMWGYSPLTVFYNLIERCNANNSSTQR